MLRILLARLGYDTAVERSFAVARIGFDRIKIENRFTRIGSLDAPQQFYIARQQRLHLRQVQVTVHRSGIERQCMAHYRTCTELPLLVDDRLQFCKKRVLCTHRRSVMHLCGGFVLGCEAVQFFEQRRFLFGLGFGYSGIGGQNGLRCRFGNAIRCTGQAAGSLQVTDQRIGLFEGGINLVVFVSGPEFEAGRSLQQLADTLRLLDAGQFHQNTAGIFEALDIGLCHTETVDTVAQHVERVGNGAFCLFAQYADHLFVGTGRGNHLAQLGRIENVAQLAAVRHLLISRGEERNIVAGAAFLGLPGLGERLVEHRVLAVVGQCAHDVFNRNLEHDVHTAAQVETEVDLFLLALLVVELHEPEVIHGLRLDGVQIILLLDRIPGGITGGLLLDMARHKRERKLVRAGYCKNNRQKF